MFHVGVRLQTLNGVSHRAAANLTGRDLDACRLAHDREIGNPFLPQELMHAGERSRPSAILFVWHGLDLDIGAQGSLGLRPRRAGNGAEEPSLHIGRSQTIHPTVSDPRLQRIRRPARRRGNGVDVPIEEDERRSSGTTPCADDGKHSLGRRRGHKPISLAQGLGVDRDNANRVRARFRHQLLDQRLRRPLSPGKRTRRDESREPRFNPSSVPDHFNFPGESGRAIRLE
jgi:hypothetical protein